MLKNPSARFPKALQGWLGSKKIEEVECVISDIAGVVRGKAMQLSKFDRLENVYMPSSIFYQTISLCIYSFFAANPCSPWSHTSSTIN